MAKPTLMVCCYSFFRWTVQSTGAVRTVHCSGLYGAMPATIVCNRKNGLNHKARKSLVSGMKDHTVAFHKLGTLHYTLLSVTVSAKMETESV